MIGLLACLPYLAPQGETLNDGWDFSAWKDTTNMHPFSAMLMVLFAMVILLGKRRSVLVCLAVAACSVTFAQRFVIAGLDFPVLRVLVLVGWIRLILNGETRGFRLHAVDKAMLAWGVSICFFYVLRVGLETPGLLEAAFVYRCGWSIDNLMLFFLFRYLIRDWQDVIDGIRVFAWISLPLALLFFIESQTRYNAFSILGGVPAETVIRAGKLRCAGSFSHPILAGCFWAAAVPMFAALLRCGRRDKRWLQAVAVLSALVIVVCCNSSTPVVGVAAGAFATCLFFVRAWTSVMRLGTVVALTVLHFVREQPVWHLIALVDITGGSTGWHRFNLLNQFILNWNEWVVRGIASVRHWNVHYGDITNFYILQGVHGGLAAFVFFVLMLYFTFRAVGRVVRACDGEQQRWLMWMLGACIFVHCVSFIGVSYASKPLLLFYMHIAMIVAIDQRVTAGAELGSFPGLQGAPASKGAPVDLAAVPPGAVPPGAVPPGAVPSTAGESTTEST